MCKTGHFTYGIHLPFYYRRLAGNIPDVSTVKVYLKELELLGYSKIKVVKDRGFYNVENINALYKEHIKFVIGGKTIKWDYEQVRPYKGDVLKDDRRMYLHLYYNPEKALEDEMNFNRMILSLKVELESGKCKSTDEALYVKYFDIKETPKRGLKLTIKEDACEEAKKLYGYFILLSNDIKDPVEALRIYRAKDVVEKSFGNIKKRLNGRRMLASSDAALDGNLFVQFIALILISYIRKHRIDKKLFGKDPYIGEILTRQLDIYCDMDVQAPESITSLCVDVGM